MSSDQLLVLGILGVSLILFVLEKPRVDVVALLALIASVVTRLVTPEEAFMSFANPAVITVWAVFIVSGGLFRTGVADRIGDLLLQFAGSSQTRLLIVTMLIAGIMSAFMNNIGAVAILLPAVITLSRKLSTPPSKMLMPLAVASLLGGNITLIGTPPNLLASAEMARYGITPFGFFDYAPTGIAVLVVGIIYMLVAGRHILPDRTGSEDVTEGYDVQERLTHLIVPEQSPLTWKKINGIRFGIERDATLIFVHRKAGKAGNEPEYIQQASDRLLRPGDVLLIRSSDQNAALIAEDFGLAIVEETDEELEDTGRITEIILTPQSIYKGKTLRQLGFRSRFGVTILSIRHDSEPITKNVADQPLRFGDVMLAQGSRERINRLRANPNMIVLDDEKQVRRKRFSRRATVILLGTLIGLATVTIIGNRPNNILNIAQDQVGYWVSLVMLCGGLGMVLTRCLTMEEAYRSIDWKSVFLIAGMLPMGIALHDTGTDVLMADTILSILGMDSPIVVMVGLYILATILTSVISNAAATVLLVPIAIQTANQLSVNPQPFVMTAVIGASCAFLLPIGHQANVIVYGAGGYKFFDFFRVGIWLNILLLFVVALLIPLIWPLH